MKTEEVPQEDADAFGLEFPAIQYAQDESGHYTTVKSVGWNPKTVVMQNAWDFEREKAEKARELVRKGRRSPLYYHARKNLMNTRMLAGYAGVSWITVWLHFRPRGFRKLSLGMLEKYAQIFGYKQTEVLLTVEGQDEN